MTKDEAWIHILAALLFGFVFGFGGVLFLMGVL
jgi:hypothetical protein